MPGSARMFAALGLRRGSCTADEARRRYIELARRHHPDANGAEADAKKFAAVTGARPPAPSEYAARLAQLHAARLRIGPRLREPRD